MRSSVCPSYKSGYATDVSQSAHPNLWSDFREGFVFGLGNTGNTLRGVVNPIHGALTNIGSAEGWKPALGGSFIATPLTGQPSVRFDKDQGGYGGIQDANPLDMEDEDFTVASWVYPEILTSQRYYVCKATALDFDAMNYGLGFNGSSFEFGVSASDGGTSSKRIAGGTAIIGRWYFVAGIHKAGGSMELYVDGVSVATGVAIATTASNTGELVLGRLYSGSTSLSFEGCIHSALLWGRALKASELATITHDPLAMFRTKALRVFAPSEGNAYTLTCSTGAFALTGNTTELPAARQLPATVGAFALTGISTGITADRKLSASVESFALTGNAAALNYGSNKTLTAESTSFALTGNAAALNYGSNKTLTAESTSFALTGNAAALNYSLSKTLVAESGSFAVTGQATELTTARQLPATVGAFALTGPSVNLSRGYVLLAGLRIIAAGGLGRDNADLIAARKLPTSVGAFVLTGVSASVVYSGDLSTASLISIRNESLRTASATASLKIATATANLDNP